MNTTVDLPDALAKEIQRRAEQEGRKVDDVVADMLRAGMTPEIAATDNGLVVTKALPLIKVRPAALGDMKSLTGQEWCEWIKEQDLQSEVERYEKAFGHQHVDRADA